MLVHLYLFKSKPQFYQLVVKLLLRVISGGEGGNRIQLESCTRHCTAVSWTQTPQTAGWNCDAENIQLLITDLENKTSQKIRNKKKCNCIVMCDVSKLFLRSLQYVRLPSDAECTQNWQLISENQQLWSDEIVLHSFWQFEHTSLQQVMPKFFT